MNENRNPVHKHMVLEYQNDKGSWSFAVLTANNTSDAMRCDDNIDAQGEIGLPISHLIGGLKKPYNIIILRVTAKV